MAAVITWARSSRASMTARLRAAPSAAASRRRRIRYCETGLQLEVNAALGKALPKNLEIAQEIV